MIIKPYPFPSFVYSICDFLRSDINFFKLFYEKRRIYKRFVVYTIIIRRILLIVCKNHEEVMQNYRQAERRIKYNLCIFINSKSYQAFILLSPHLRCTAHSVSVPRVVHERRSSIILS